MSSPSQPPGASAAVSRPQRRESLFLLLFPLLALLLLWDVLPGGRVLLPAEYLKAFSPWSAAYPQAARDALPQWNILQWDGMAEFYPWRLHLARSLAAGRIPLWNPYALCGTPFLANSQSAPLYPLHLLYALPLGVPVAVRMGWLAFLHLSLAGIFAYFLARDLGARPGAAAVGGAAFELCGFAVAWLELPSFISVACWIPLVLLLLGRATRFHSWRGAAGAGAAAGMMLLAGHLQVAFYGLIAAGCVWAWETGFRVQGSGFRVQGVQVSEGSGRSAPSSLHTHTPPETAFPTRSRGGQAGAGTHPPKPLPRQAAGAGRSPGQAHTHTRHVITVQAIAIGLVALLIALGLAAPQVLPAVELSRMSHRAGAPTVQGYAGYVRLALSLPNWVNLLVPDYYGLPARNNFWGVSGYGAAEVMEYAGSVGAAAWVLAVIGLFGGRKVSSRALLMAALGGVSLLLATGSPLSRLLYFHVPGFAQSGSPARSLVLFCLAQAMLAALGMEWVLRRSEERWTDAARVLGVGLAVTGALGLGLHGLALAGLPRDSSLLDQMVSQVAAPALARALLYAAVLVVVLVLLAWLLRENKASHRLGALWVAGVAVVAGGLLFTGGAYNQTAPRGMVYPETPLTGALKRAGRRAVTLNREWSLIRPSPALLPPNASLACGWRDAQGYDSLYLNNYRRLANAINLPGQASPESNGNIVFIKHAASPLLPLLAARYVVSREPLPRAGLVPARGFPPGPPYVYEDRQSLPEAYVTPHWNAADDSEGLDILQRQAAQAAPGVDPLETFGTVLLARGPGVPPAPILPRMARARSGPPMATAASVERQGPGRIVVRARAARPSLLVLAEGYTPGWKATLQAQGQPPRRLPVWRANIAFQAVMIPPGPVTVEWRYEPASFRAGLFLALAALSGLLALLISRPRGGDGPAS